MYKLVKPGFFEQVINFAQAVAGAHSQSSHDASTVNLSDRRRTATKVVACPSSGTDVWLDMVAGVCVVPLGGDDAFGR
jgi:hypothetical protein